MNEVAKEYAKAIFDLALEQKEIQKYQEQLIFTSEVIKQNSDLNKLLLSPLDIKEKREVVDSIFSGKIAKHILHFVFILVENNRLMLLEQINTQYDELIKLHEEQVQCDVYSVVLLTDVEKDKLTKKLSQKFGKNIILNNYIDKSLIGGMKIVADNTVIDFSIKNKLNNIKKVN